MSIAFLDPGNLAADLDAGNKAGYHLLWSLLLATIIGWYFQILSAKLGVVTQRNMARLCREQYSKSIRIILWLMTEVAIIAVDIQEVIGSSIALHILFGIPIQIGAIITIIDSLVFLFIHYFGIRKLEVFFGILILIMATCFFINFFTVQPDISQLIQGTFLIRIPQGTVYQTIAIFGCIIMPHNLYLHSALVLSRKLDNNNTNVIKEATIYNSIESGISLFVSFLINYSVIGTFAYWQMHEPNKQLNLSNAAWAFESTFGTASKYIWAIGLLAAGQSSTMTGTYAGQFVMEGFLNIQLPVWKRVLLTRSIAILPAISVTFFTDFEKVDTFLNILQSIQLSFALIPLIKFTNSDQIMGSQFKNTQFQNSLAIILAIILFAFNIIGLWPLNRDYNTYMLIIFSFILYLLLLILVLRAPVHRLDANQIDYQDEEISKIEVEFNKLR